MAIAPCGDVTAAGGLLIVVPARGGSKRLPGKNLARIAGHSLLAHTAAVIRVAGLSAPVVLSTDDDDIAAEGARLGWHVPFRRPARLSDDQATTVDTVRHAVDSYRAATDYNPDTVMVLQATSPFRPPNLLSEAVDILRLRPAVDAVVAISPLARSPRTVFRCQDGDSLVPVGDDTAPLYTPNGALYLIRSTVLSVYQDFFPPRTVGVPVTRDRALDIDTVDDLALAALMAADRPNLVAAAGLTP